MKIHELGAREALESLDTTDRGLSAGEAGRRLREFGPNRIERLAAAPRWRSLLRPLVHFFALILWAAAGLAFLAESRHPGAGMGTLGTAILGVILVNGLFSFWQESRAEGAIAALQRLLPVRVKAWRDAQVAPVAAETLVPGDVVLLEAGDLVPADCRVIESYGATVSNAVVTGESLPQPRDALPSREESVLRSRNTLLAGTSLASGDLRAVVFATGMNTEFGRIARLTQTAKPVESPLLREIRDLSRLVALLSLALGALFFLIGRRVGLSFWENFVFAIGIIVANVPEGLLPTVTLALSIGAERMARRNALIRHLPSVETLGSATTICTDKTGTLTQNRMAVRRLYLGDRSYEAPGEIAGLGATHRRFFEVAYACHNLKPSNHGWLGDPLEIALTGLAREVLPRIEAPDRVYQIPFDSDRRRLTTVHRAGDGLAVYTKGALESLLPLCSGARLMDGSAPLDASRRERFLRAEEAMAASGLRVLALAARDASPDEDRVAFERSLTLLGLVGFEDPPRPEVPAAVRSCLEAGIQVIMVTGDHPSTAAAVAREIGLAPSGSPRVVTGEQLQRLSDVQLQLALGVPEILFARVTADQKMRIVGALKRKGEIVAVTGDGVNDAPALRLGDIGIAMGRSGTDVARESADMVLMDDNFASIVHAVEEGRTVYANIRKFLTYILTSNVAELVPYLAFVLFRIPLPLTIIQILAVDLGTDIVPALGLGAERPRSDVMKRPPRARGERLLDRGLLARAYLVLGPLEAAAAMGAFFFVLHRGGWRHGATLGAQDPLYLGATAACLSAIVVTQIVNVQLCRDERASALTLPLFGNRLILAGIAVEIFIILLLDYTPFGHALFGTARFAAETWLFMLPFAVAMLAIEEGRKALARRRSPRREADPRRSSPAIRAAPPLPG